MKTFSVLMFGTIAFLVILRFNGVVTEVPAIDAMVRLLMESIRLA